MSEEGKLELIKNLLDGWIYYGILASPFAVVVTLLLLLFPPPTSHSNFFLVEFELQKTLIYCVFNIVS